MSSPAEPASGPAAADAPRPPTGRRGRRRAALVAAATVVAAVAVIAGLYAGGLLPLGRPGNHAPTFAPTFQGAASAGQPTANAAPGGPWQPAIGVALRLPDSITVPPANFTQYLGAFGGSTGCRVSLDPELAGDVQVQGTPASAGAGASAFWVVVYVNGTGGALGVMVNGGVAAPLLSLGGNATCRATLRYLVPFPSGAPDSPAVVDSANAAGGRAFLVAHPNATQVFLGISVVLLLPTWEVVYTTCSLTLAANTTGSQYNATVSGTTVQTHANGTATCSLPTNTTLPGGLRPVVPPPALGPPPALPAVGKAI